MTRNLRIRIEVPGVESKNRDLILKDCTEEDAEEIVNEIFALTGQGIRELKVQGHKICIG